MFSHPRRRCTFFPIICTVSTLDEAQATTTIIIEINSSRVLAMVNMSFCAACFIVSLLYPESLFYYKKPSLLVAKTACKFSEYLRLFQYVKHQVYLNVTTTYFAPD